MKIILKASGEMIDAADSYGRRMLEMGKARIAAAPTQAPAKGGKARKKADAVAAAEVREDEPERQD